MKKKIIISVIVALAFVVGVAVTILVVNAVKETTAELLGGSGATEPKCSVSSTQIATIGHQLSSTILAANETRAWARIQAPNNATNTNTLSFDEGATAVINRGVTIGSTAGVGTSTTDSIEFGRNTTFPYTGAVTGISNNGSSTVLVTECSY